MAKVYPVGVTLAEVMHVHIPTLAPDSTFRDAVDKMDIYQFPGLVVVDHDKVPVGVVTEGDLVRAATQNREMLSLSDRRALDFGTREPTCANPAMEVADALDMMISRGLNLLPIVMESKLAGVVLRVDLMQALLMDASTPLPDRD
jgi:CBS domain-containing protein